MVVTFQLHQAAHVVGEVLHSPSRALARTIPMLRTSVPTMSLLWAPNTCSTRARTFERVALPRFSRSLSSLLPYPLTVDQALRGRDSFSFAPISADR